MDDGRTETMAANAPSDDEQIVKVAEADDNIFAAMGLPDAAEASDKADLVFEITRAMRDAGWTQAKAAKRAGITPADMSRILRGRTENYSIARLESVLLGLGRDVVKVIVPTTRASGRGATSVAYHDRLPVAVMPHNRD